MDDMESKAQALVTLASRPIRTVTGNWEETLYFDGVAECVSLVFGQLPTDGPVICRVHSFCFASHALLSVECDCIDQLQMAQEMIVDHGAGLVIVLMQDGRGFGHMVEMLAAHRATERRESQDAAYAKLVGRSDARDYTSAALILRDRSISEVHLITNNPDKAESLVQCGIRVASMLPAAVEDLQGRPELEDAYRAKRQSGHRV